MSAVRDALVVEASDHIAAAEDILDYLDRGSSVNAADDLTSAVKALTHATLAVARYTQANGAA